VNNPQAKYYAIIDIGLLVRSRRPGPAAGLLKVAVSATRSSHEI